jgi:Fanconi anemia group J protein
MNDSMMFELAQIIFDICNVVPHGVLVFVSSYRVLQQLKSAFYNSGLIRKLEAKKEVFYEPKKSSEMNLILFNYDEAIKSPRKNCDGAVMFAVFRGKVSEGLDFADNKARAVVIVGIPYPSVADQQVLQKRSFNDLNAQTHNIVKGSDWYEIQAYRAVNQALGRCLRHKEDWGALILIDERKYL